LSMAREFASFTAPLPPLCAAQILRALMVYHAGFLRRFSMQFC
jgi:hypothetical protein